EAQSQRLAVIEESRATRYSRSIVLDGPPLRKEAAALRGPGHLREEMRGVQARGETIVHLETPHVAKKDTCDTLRGDAPLGGVHQEETLH
ncbi:hypothetical protein A2U01_0081933, partial [Trifolium medium]|nr:hypothetical protein [Trifolium medium]